MCIEISVAKISLKLHIQQVEADNELVASLEAVIDKHVASLAADTARIAALESAMQSLESNLTTRTGTSLC